MRDSAVFLNFRALFRLFSKADRIFFQKWIQLSPFWRILVRKDSKSETSINPIYGNPFPVLAFSMLPGRRKICEGRIIFVSLCFVAKAAFLCDN